GVAHLRDRIRWEVLHAVVGGAHARPALLGALPPGQQGAREVGISADAAHNGVEGYLLQPGVLLLADLELLADLRKAEQPVGPAGKLRDDLFKRAPLSGPMKVAERVEIALVRYFHCRLSPLPRS